ncbi:CAP domain-containing protein [Mycolicibacterium stellerae]|uniref:CAP domain-containing protein n=1 Tax=Mycolicibacterium stellerae TaxID=2358193 RepID=UPI0013DDC5EB|nr:CAP domain-containing protein [Mycolicibacterium stellerae]
MKRKQVGRYVFAPLSVATLTVLAGVYSPASIALADPSISTGVGSVAGGFKLAPDDRPDGDGDGLFDDDEVEVYFTDPKVADTDSDGSSDGEEVYVGTDPKVKNAAAARPDGDGDGLFDDDEVNVYGTDPKVADTDKDGADDGQEVFDKTDPKAANNAGNNGPANGGNNGPANGGNNGPANGGNPAAGDFSGEVLALINGQRAAAGCAALPSNGQLSSAAARHANDMLKNKLASDQHTGSDGSSAQLRFNDSGYPAGHNANSSGEIVFSAPGLTPQSTVDGWMNSAGHKAIITNCSWTDIGVASVSDGTRLSSVGVFGKHAFP